MVSLAAPATGIRSSARSAPGRRDRDRPAGLGRTDPPQLTCPATPRLRWWRSTAPASSGATVVGHSLGAGVAAWLAHRAPGPGPRRCVLVAPAANVDALEPVDRLLAAPVHRRRSPPPSPWDRSGWRWRRRRSGDWHRGRSGSTSATCASVGRASLAPAAGARSSPTSARWWPGLPELDARLGEITAPTTIVVGSADRVVPVAASRRALAPDPRRAAGRTRAPRAPAAAAKSGRAGGGDRRRRRLALPGCVGSALLGGPGSGTTGHGRLVGIGNVAGSLRIRWRARVGVDRRHRRVRDDRGSPARRAGGPPSRSV